MLVKDLIKQLQDMDQTAEVHFAYNYGDYWRTEVAPAIGRVNEGVVEYSDYHQMDKIVDSEEMYDEESGDLRTDVRRVVVLD